MAAAFPSGNPGNTYVPSFESSGQLVVSYSRNPKDFPLNSYITLVPVKKTVGYYLRITPENAARLLTADGADNVWASGADAPQGNWNSESFEFFPYTTTRFAFTVPLDYKSVEQASWKITAYHAAMLAQQAMTLRTLRAITVYETSGNWATGNTGTFANAVTSGGGSSAFFAGGTPTNPAIFYALTYGARQINVATLGTVKPKDLVFVINPDTARKGAGGQEVHTYLKENPVALQVLKGEGDFNPNAQWGMPPQIYGFKIAVEDCVRVNSNKGQTLAEDYAKSGTSGQLLARPGALVGVEGAPSFSTVQAFSYEEMTVESKDDTDNRVHKLRVVDDYDMRLVSPISGYNFTNLFA